MRMTAETGRQADRQEPMPIVGLGELTTTLDYTAALYSSAAANE